MTPPLPAAAVARLACGGRIRQHAVLDAVLDPAPPLDPTTGLVTREHAEKMLTQLAAVDAGKSPVTVALVELAPDRLDRPDSRMR